MMINNVPELSESILLFMESPAFAIGLSTVPSWKIVQVRTFDEFSNALTQCKYSMVIALSPFNDSGAAGRAIQDFRDKNPSGLTVYHGWDYRLGVSGPRALACKADVLLIGGILDWNLLYCLGTALLMKSRYGIEPSLEFYTKLLEKTCSESPFWRLQETSLAVSEIE